MQQALDEGEVRVIVRLDVAEGPDGWLESDMLRGIRRGDIARARDVVRSSLLNVPHRVHREFEDFPFLALSTGAAGLRVLESLPGAVVQVVEDRLNRPFLLESIPLVQADQLWAGGFGGMSLDGAGTVVAVLDTGVDKNHPFLAGKVVEEACFSSNDGGGTSVCPGGATSSFAPGSGMPCDLPDCDHGTHVAGIAAGDGKNGTVAAFSGVAKGAGIMAIQVFTEFNNSAIGAFDSDIMAGLERVFDLREVHNFAAANLSLGGGRFTSNCDGQPMKAVIDALKSANIATVVASGNDGFTNAISFPACISSAVSVGATNDGSQNTTADTIPSFSNSASFLSLLAPGRWINSSVPGNSFENFQGTSMATPHVAGAFALLREASSVASINELLAVLTSTGLPVRDPRNSITKPRIRILDAALEILSFVRFRTGFARVNKSAPEAVITVVRLLGAGSTVTVDFETSNGSAIAGTDYTATSGTLVFNAGEKQKTFTIPILNNELAEGNKTVNLTLSNAAEGAILGTPQKAVLTIVGQKTRKSLTPLKASIPFSRQR